MSATTPMTMLLGMQQPAVVLRMAEDFTLDVLRDDPFGATLRGFAQFDSLVPVVTEAARLEARQRLVEVLLRCDQLAASGHDGLLLAALSDTAARQLAHTDSGVDEWMVTPLFRSGLPLMLLVAASTELADAPAAAAYLRRLRSCDVYLDQCAQALLDAAAAGRIGVAPLIASSIGQHRRYLSSQHSDPLTAPAAPDGWSGAPAWRDDVQRVVEQQIRPAVRRYLDVLLQLLPLARPEERPGLLHVPGGTAAYAACIRTGTSLTMDPDELHTVGAEALRDAMSALTALGAKVYGLHTTEEVLLRMRALPIATPEQLLARSAAAVRRAEAVSGELLRTPLHRPCEIRAMPTELAEAGSPPSYTPPARDGSRQGVYLVNVDAPGPAGSWGLESICFHETVPGHHAQYDRLYRADLPALLTAFDVDAHAEGWGLYAEQLADELGLYSDDEQRLGRLAATAWRALRLVVDTGLHARGWTRERAVQFASQHTPLPQGFVSREIDRYIAWPGQALAYHVGLREILRLRALAKQRLGSAFDLPGFHSALLDNGNLPLPVLARAVEQWITDQDHTIGLRSPPPSTSGTRTTPALRSPSRTGRTSPSGSA